MATFRFAIWLRWPTTTAYHDVGVACCLTSYLSSVASTDSMVSLSAEQQGLIHQNVSLTTLARMCSPEFIDFPTFSIYNIDGKPFTENDVLADAIWFFFAFRNTSDDRRKDASLAKFHQLTRKNAFRYNWIVSESTFKKSWAKGAAAAPFRYVEKSHSSLDWEFDPIAPGFVDAVDDLLGHSDQVAEYMGRCKIAIAHLKGVIDARAWSRMKFPEFPDELEEINFSPRPLPQLTIDKLEEALYES